jgi:hypothetical protein
VAHADEDAYTEKQQHFRTRLRIVYRKPLTEDASAVSVTGWPSIDVPCPRGHLADACRSNPSERTHFAPG